jgi:hypothetical protein
VCDFPDFLALNKNYSPAQNLPPRAPPLMGSLWGLELTHSSLRLRYENFSKSFYFGIPYGRTIWNDLTPNA